MSESADTIPAHIDTGVKPIYPDFAVNGDRAADFVADPAGPIGLTPEALGASVAVDADVSIRGSTGSVYDVTSPLVDSSIDDVRIESEPTPTM